MRISDEIWHAALERAKREGRSLSELMQDVIAAYARGDEIDPSK